MAHHGSGNEQFSCGRAEELSKVDGVTNTQGRSCGGYNPVSEWEEGPMHGKVRNTFSHIAHGLHVKYPDLHMQCDGVIKCARAMSEHRNRDLILCIRVHDQEQRRTYCGFEGATRCGSRVAALCFEVTLARGKGIMSSTYLGFGSNNESDTIYLRERLNRAFLTDHGHDLYTREFPFAKSWKEKGQYLARLYKMSVSIVLDEVEYMYNTSEGEGKAKRLLIDARAPLPQFIVTNNDAHFTSKALCGWVKTTFYINKTEEGVQKASTTTIVGEEICGLEVAPTTVNPGKEGMSGDFDDALRDCRFPSSVPSRTTPPGGYTMDSSALARWGTENSCAIDLTVAFEKQGTHFTYVPKTCLYHIEVCCNDTYTKVFSIARKRGARNVIRGGKCGWRSRSGKSITKIALQRRGEAIKREGGCFQRAFAKKFDQTSLVADLPAFISQEVLARWCEKRSLQCVLQSECATVMYTPKRVWGTLRLACDKDLLHVYSMQKQETAEEAVLGWSEDVVINLGEEPTAGFDVYRDFDENYNCFCLALERAFPNEPYLWFEEVPVGDATTLATWCREKDVQLTITGADFRELEEQPTRRTVTYTPVNPGRGIWVNCEMLGGMYIHAHEAAPFALVEKCIGWDGDAANLALRGVTEPLNPPIHTGHFSLPDDGDDTVIFMERNVEANATGEQYVLVIDELGYRSAVKPLLTTARFFEVEEPFPAAITFGMNYAISTQAIPVEAPEAVGAFSDGWFEVPADYTETPMANLLCCGLDTTGEAITSWCAVDGKYSLEGRDMGCSGELMSAIFQLGVAVTSVKFRVSFIGKRLVSYKGAFLPVQVGAGRSSVYTGEARNGIAILRADASLFLEGLWDGHKHATFDSLALEAFLAKPEVMKAGLELVHEDDLVGNFAEQTYLAEHAAAAAAADAILEGLVADQREIFDAEAQRVGLPEFPLRSLAYHTTATTCDQRSALPLLAYDHGRIANDDSGACFYAALKKCVPGYEVRASFRTGPDDIEHLAVVNNTSVLIDDGSGAFLSYHPPLPGFACLTQLVVRTEGAHVVDVKFFQSPASTPHGWNDVIDGVSTPVAEKPAFSWGVSKALRDMRVLQTQREEDEAVQTTRGDFGDGYGALTPLSIGDKIIDSNPDAYCVNRALRAVGVEAPLHERYSVPELQALAEKNKLMFVLLNLSGAQPKITIAPTEKKPTIALIGHYKASTSDNGALFDQWGMHLESFTRNDVPQDWQKGLVIHAEDVDGTIASQVLAYEFAGETKRRQPRQQPCATLALLSKKLDRIEQQNKQTQQKKKPRTKKKASTRMPKKQPVAVETTEVSNAASFTRDHQPRVAQAAADAGVLLHNAMQDWSQFPRTRTGVERKSAVGNLILQARDDTEPTDMFTFVVDLTDPFRRTLCLVMRGANLLSQSVVEPDVKFEEFMRDLEPLAHKVLVRAGLTFTGGLEAKSPLMLEVAKVDANPMNIERGDLYKNSSSRKELSTMRNIGLGEEVELVNFYYDKPPIQKTGNVDVNDPERIASGAVIMDVTAVEQPLKWRINSQADDAFAKAAGFSSVQQDIHNHGWSTVWDCGYDPTGKWHGPYMRSLINGSFSFSFRANVDFATDMKHPTPPPGAEGYVHPQGDVYANFFVTYHGIDEALEFRSQHFCSLTQANDYGQNQRTLDYSFIFSENHPRYEELSGRLVKRMHVTLQFIPTPASALHVDEVAMRVRMENIQAEFPEVNAKTSYSVIRYTGVVPKTTFTVTENLEFQGVVNPSTKTGAAMSSAEPDSGPMVHYGSEFSDLIGRLERGGREQSVVTTDGVAQAGVFSDLFKTAVVPLLGAGSEYLASKIKSKAAAFSNVRSRERGVRTNFAFPSVLSDGRAFRYVITAGGEAPDETPARLSFSAQEGMNLSVHTHSGQPAWEGDSAQFAFCLAQLQLRGYPVYQRNVVVSGEVRNVQHYHERDRAHYKCDVYPVALTRAKVTAPLADESDMYLFTPEGVRNGNYHLVDLPDNTFAHNNDIVKQTSDGVVFYTMTFSTTA